MNIVEVKKKIKTYLSLYIDINNFDDNMSDLIDNSISEFIREASIKVNLADSIKSKNFNNFLKIKSIVAGKDLLPYIIPKTFLFKCNRNPNSKPYKKCAFCPAYNAIGLTEDEQENRKDDIFNIDFKDDKHRHLIADIVKKTTEKQEKILKLEFADIDCKYMTIQSLTTQVLEDVNIIPEIDFENFDDEYVIRQAYILSEDIKTNNVYNLYGVTIPNPQSQQAILVVNEAEKTADNIDKFKLTDEIIEKLSIFRVGQNQTLHSKLSDIYDDLIHNVTKMYQRGEIIFAIDMVFYSVLRFRFLGDIINKGWVEGLIIGDTRTGKSKTAERLVAHYKVGEIVSGENTTLAGLLAGVKQVGNNWNLMWGKIPLNDKRVVVVDEASGISVEELSQLSSVRASGIAEVTKIQMQKTYARTRLLWISNPRPMNKTISQYAYGIMSAKELFGRPEDIARLDFALVVAFEDVPQEIFNSRHEKKVEHKYTSELSNLLVMFAWSRKADDILILKKTEDYILEKAKYLSGKYSSAMPLVNSSEIREKIAKLSVALAVRVFNYDVDKKKIIVTNEHVDYVINFIDYIYSKDCSGYDMFSEQRKKESTLQDEIYLKELIVKPEMFNILLDSNRFTVNDIADIFEVEKKDARLIAGKLIRIRAIRKEYSAYKKNPAFIKWLKINKNLINKRTVDIPTVDIDEQEVPF